METLKQPITCPKCFARGTGENHLFVCNNDACKSVDKRISFADAKLIAGQPHCPDCERALTRRLCPACGFEFGGHSPGAQMLGLSMVGAEGCGKSHFLSVLINGIKKEMTRVYGCSLYPLGGEGTIAQYNKNYHEPLFEQGQCLSPTTQEDVEPLIYSLVFPKGNRNGKTANLTFYDACGSNFEDVRVMEEGNRSIYNSRGVLLMIDPTQFLAIRDRRRLRGQSVNKNNVDPVTLLSRVIHLIRAGSGQNDLRKKISIPIAVCLTKMDIVRPWLDASSFIDCRSRHLRRPAFSLPDFQSCHLEIMSLIESWSNKELISQVETQFERFGFFAFSALGEEPTPDGKIQHIQPHRVMDPLLWLLYQNRIINASKK